MRKTLMVALLAVGFMPLAGRADPNTTDTRLLSNPGVSKDHIAFVYAEDLWIANLDGSDPKH